MLNITNVRYVGTQPDGVHRITVNLPIGGVATDLDVVFHPDALANRRMIYDLTSDDAALQAILLEHAVRMNGLAPKVVQDHAAHYAYLQTQATCVSVKLASLIRPTPPAPPAPAQSHPGLVF